jgi:hypothetical protein
MENAGHFASGLFQTAPVFQIFAKIVAHKGTPELFNNNKALPHPIPVPSHCHWIVHHSFSFVLCCRCRFRFEACPGENAMLPRECLKHQWNSLGPATPENDGINWDTS